MQTHQNRKLGREKIQRENKKVEEKERKGKITRSKLPYKLIKLNKRTNQRTKVG